MTRDKRVPVRFIDDGHPEAREYDNNYVYATPGGWRLLSAPLRQVPVSNDGSPMAMRTEESVPTTQSA